MDVATRPATGWSAGWQLARSRTAEAFRNRQTRNWYLGAGFGLIYQVIMLITVWTEPQSILSRGICTLMLLVYYAGFLFLPPIFWSAPKRQRLIAVAVYWLASLPFLPFLQADILWLWPLVVTVAAVLFEEFILVAAATVFLVAIPLIYGFLTNFTGEAVFSAIVTFSVGSMMFGMNRQIRAIRELRAAQGEVARLAVVEERARFSRDMHDVLGHSLTVVTVKSELARRLISIDPVKAEEELADIERLSRGALADLRAAVTGYREMSLSTELAVAQAALAAANIEAHLPRSGDVAAPDLQEVFGWVLREGVTNVIRHSGASNCWIELKRSSLSIADDGGGIAGEPGDRSAGGTLRVVDDECPGNGLRGLAERASEAGARLTLGNGPHGGANLVVARGNA